MYRWKLAVVMLISLWLPLQGVAGIVMPFCKHAVAGSAGASHVAHADHAGPDGHPAGHAAHEGGLHPATVYIDSPGPTLALSACDNCGHCQLSCAATLPSPGLPAAVCVSFAAPSFTPSLPHGTVPSPLHRPPLFALT